MSSGPFSGALLASQALGHGINPLDPKYGAKGDGVTDDTGPVAKAIADASAQAPLNGSVDVVLAPGAGFLLGQILPKNNVRVVAYGATIIPNLAGIVNAVFGHGFLAALTRFSIYGGFYQGTGTETLNQCVFQKFNNNSSMADCVFRDMHIVNWGTGALQFGNPTRVLAIGNNLQTIGDGGLGLNAIVANVTGPVAASDFIFKDNIVIGALAPALGYVNTQAAGSGDVRGIIANNIAIGSTSNGQNPKGSGAIIVEFDGAAGGPWTSFIVEGNHVNNPNANANAFCLSVGVGGAVIQKVLLRANTLKGVVNGIHAGNVADLQIDGNRIDAPVPLQMVGGQTYSGTGNKLSTGPSQGQVTLAAGAATVLTAEVQTGDNIVLSRVAGSGALGFLSVGTITAGTSFTITSSSGTDTSRVYWRIDH